MAVNVSENYRTTVYSGEAIYDCDLKIDNVSVPYTQIESIIISDPIIDNNSNSFYIGTFISKQLTIKFKNLNNLNIYSGANVDLSISLLVDDEPEPVIIGKFLIDELAENYQKTNEITCLDYAVKFKPNVDYSNAFYKLTQDISINSRKAYYERQGTPPDYKFVKVVNPVIEDIDTYYENTGKATLIEILTWICNHFGVTLGTYPNINNNVEAGVFDNTVSGKRFISYIAEMFGGNAKIDRSGILNIIPLTNTPSVTIDAEKSKKWILGEKYKITKVIYTDAIRNYSYGDETNNTLFIRTDNIFVSDTNQIQNIYNAVKNFEIYSIENENIGDISLDAWDIIGFSIDNATYRTFNNNEITYKTSIMTKINSKIPTEQQEITTNIVGGTEEAKFKRVATNIDTVNARIDLLSEEITTISNTVSGLGTITLENAFEGELYNLSIKGQISLLYPASETGLYGYPAIISDNLIVSNNTYVSSNIPANYEILYPSNDLFGKNTNLLVDDTIYKLDFDFLNYINDEICDEYVYENGKQYIIRRVGVDDEGEKYPLQTEMIENKKDLSINVKNNSTITLTSFPSAKITSKYLLQNEYTDVFANKVETKAEITLTNNKIEETVSAVIDGDSGKITPASIVLAINGDESTGEFSADKLSLKGKEINLTGDDITISSNKFNVDSNGNMTCSNANITGGTMSVGTNFSVSPEGQIIATAGNIAGFLMDNKSFTKNVSGIYNYDGYDLRICQSILLGSINPDFTTQHLMDATGDGQVTPADLLKIQQIVSGESTSTKNANAVFEINSYDPKHCISVKDTNTVVASLGIGGVNGTTGTFRNIIASTNENPQTSVNINGVNGSIYASGTITPGSREELKKNIEIYDNALDDVINTDIYSYNLKAEEDGSKKHIGFVIGDKRNYSHNITTEINGEEIGADLYSMTSVLWKAVQEQQKIIESLQNQINELKESDK